MIDKQLRMTDPRPHIVAFSGHRTFKMQGDDLFSSHSAEEEPADTLAGRLDHQLDLLLAAGYDTFLCGMAEGFDLEAAEAVLRLKGRNRQVPGTASQPIRLIAVIPYQRQAARFSPTDRNRYDAAIRQADERILLSPTYYAGCFHARNDYLVDHASLLLCYYNGTKGGTQYTVHRALKRGVPVINLYP